MNAIHDIEDLIRLLDENPEWLEALRARLLTRELLELPETLTQLATKVDSFVEATNQRLAALERKVDSLERKVQSIQDDVGVLKGAHVRSASLREASSIAREMDLRRTRNLTTDDLWALIDRADTADIPTNELRSFRRADLIMEVTDADDKTCYIAVEISFTANGRDTTRAIRNAGFLRRFTGKCAYAAVAGRHLDHRIQDCIESGEVFWYQLGPEVMDAE